MIAVEGAVFSMHRNWRSQVIIMETVEQLFADYLATWRIVVLPPVSMTKRRPRCPKSRDSRGDLRAGSLRRYRRISS
jgi:hypothetical protein